MQSDVVVLIPLDLLVLAECSLELKLEVPVLDHQLIALTVELVQLSGVVLLPPLQLFQLLLQPHFHLGCVFAILAKQVLEMLYYILFRKVINSVSLVHVECVGTVDYRILPSN